MPFTETESTGDGAEAGILLGHTGIEVSMLYPSGDTKKGDNNQTCSQKEFKTSCNLEQIS